MSTSSESDKMHLQPELSVISELRTPCMESSDVTSEGWSFSASTTSTKSILVPRPGVSGVGVDSSPLTAKACIASNFATTFKFNPNALNFQPRSRPPALSPICQHPDDTALPNHQVTASPDHTQSSCHFPTYTEVPQPALQPQYEYTISTCFPRKNSLPSGQYPIFTSLTREVPEVSCQYPTFTGLAQSVGFPFERQYDEIDNALEDMMKYQRRKQELNYRRFLSGQRYKRSDNYMKRVIAGRHFHGRGEDTKSWRAGQAAEGSGMSDEAEEKTNDDTKKARRGSF